MRQIITAKNCDRTSPICDSLAQTCGNIAENGLRLLRQLEIMSDVLIRKIEFTCFFFQIIAAFCNGQGDYFYVGIGNFVDDGRSVLPTPEQLDDRAYFVILIVAGPAEYS